MSVLRIRIPCCWRLSAIYKARTADEAHRLIEQSDNAIEALFRIIKMTIDQMMHMNPTFFHDFKKYHPRVFKEIQQPGNIRDFSVTRNLIRDRGSTGGVQE